MTSTATPALNQALSTTTGGKPHLLSFNRKLRHVQGITLRNLNLDPPTCRARNTTIDDDALPSTLKSPVKLLAEKEHKQLLHSRSFENLKPLQDRSKSWAADAIPPAIDTHSPPGSPRRPKKPRRKSTLEWSSTSPAERHDSLCRAVSRRSAHVFFSIHSGHVQDPLYVSEVVRDATNPNFRAFDLRLGPATVTRQSNLTIRVWAKSGSSWQLHLQSSINLCSLEFIGRSLEHRRIPLHDNCLIIGLTDGFYTLPEQGSQLDENRAALLGDPSCPKEREPTSSYDALMRLATLDDRIQDAIIARERLTAEINALIEHDDQAYFGLDRLVQEQTALTQTQKSVTAERRNVQATEARLDEMRSDLHVRRGTMEAGRRMNETSATELSSNHPQLARCRAAHTHLQNDMSAQRRRICSDLAAIYPIEPIPKRQLAFTIRGLQLPNADFQSVDEDKVSAALGHVAHLVLLLSLYLSVALPYPIHPSSSNSTIQDPISIMTGTRIFPLYIPRTILYRFEYAVFLINKNIELLANKLGLRLMDIRQTLPNLKYVLFVATAGQGDLPARKTGGVRGLLSSRLEKGTPDSSRRSSIDGPGPEVASLREQLSAR